MWTCTGTSTALRTILFADSLVIILALIWSIKYWSITWGIVTTVVCVCFGLLIEIILEDVNKQKIIIIPVLITPILCIILWLM